MGYTHYFNTKGKELNGDKFLLFSDQAKRIINQAKANGIALAYESDQPDKAPLVRNDEIFFNGVGDEGHETFVLALNCNDFCKTAEKPYDTVVSAVLIAFKTVFEDKVSVTTDGTNEDWTEGKELYEEAIGMYPKIDVITQASGIGILVLTDK